MAPSNSRQAARNPEPSAVGAGIEFEVLAALGFLVLEYRRCRACRAALRRLTSHFRCLKDRECVRIPSVNTCQSTLYKEKIA